MIRPQYLTAEGGQQSITEPLTLRSMQEAVGGSIEIVQIPRLPTGHDQMVVNEEGAFCGLPLNRMASMIAGRRIVGNVIVCRTEDIA